MLDGTDKRRALTSTAAMAGLPFVAMYRMAAKSRLLSTVFENS